MRENPGKPLPWTDGLPLYDMVIFPRSERGESVAAALAPSDLILTWLPTSAPTKTPQPRAQLHQPSPPVQHREQLIRVGNQIFDALNPSRRFPLGFMQHSHRPRSLKRPIAGAMLPFGKHFGSSRWPAAAAPGAAEGGGLAGGLGDLPAAAAGLPQAAQQAAPGGAPSPVNPAAAGLKFASGIAGLPRAGSSVEAPF